MVCIFTDLPPFSTINGSPGKRYNVLRNRTDSWNYEVDQLLFGTILFTLVAFLLPTVLIYYVFFTLVRYLPYCRSANINCGSPAQIHLCIMLLQTSMETLLALMNNFSLFSLTLRIKDPWRLPGKLVLSSEETYPYCLLLGGIFFSMLESRPHNVLLIRNQPVAFALLFPQYGESLSSPYKLMLTLVKDNFGLDWHLTIIHCN